MTSARQAYATSEPLLELDEQQSPQKWARLAIWTLALTITNVCLSLFGTLMQPQERSIDLLLAFVFGNVFVIPLIIFAMSQLWQRYRNARSRLKAILYPSYFVLLSQMEILFSLAMQMLEKTG